MITALPITLAQGLALHSGCIEISQIEIEGHEIRKTSELYVRKEGELKESGSASDEEFETIVTGLRFKASVWVNENTRAQGKPPFELMNQAEETILEVDFEKYPAIAKHFDEGFNEEATRTQRLEGTCEKYIREVFVDLLKV